MVRQKLISFRGKRTQAEMAELYKVSQKTWSAWERGVRNPPVAVMKTIEDDSGIPMEQIFFDMFCNPTLEKAETTA